MFDTLLFHCAICERDVRDYPDRKGPDRQIAPICRYCEREWTEHTGKPEGGTFMDRRKALRVCALSNALRNTASLIEWRQIHARS